MLAQCVFRSGVVWILRDDTRVRLRRDSSGFAVQACMLRADMTALDVTLFMSLPCLTRLLRFSSPHRVCRFSYSSVLCLYSLSHPTYSSFEDNGLFGHAALHCGTARLFS
jgi:hypothetical protein